jgi:fido (protein-threonine AMPylation protein)
MVAADPMSVEDQTTWAQLRSSGLPETVKSYPDYKQKAASGLATAQIHLCQGDPFDMSPENVKDAHLLAFNQVDPNAGAIRKQVGCFGGNIGAEPHRVSREMEMLETQSYFLFKGAKTKTEMLQAIAFSHARFIRIHPFKDGNGRVSRAFTFSQMREAFNIPMDGIADHIAGNKADYLKSMEQTRSKNDLTPLMSFLSDGIQQANPSTEKIPVPESNPSPFNMNLDMSVKWLETSEFSDDLIKSKNPAYFDSKELESGGGIDLKLQTSESIPDPAELSIGKPIQDLEVAQPSANIVME